MEYRLMRYVVEIVILIIGLVSVDATAQVGANINRVMTSASEPVDRLIPRDPQAIAVLESALSVMGGKEAWNSAHAISASVTRVDGNNTNLFIWTDKRNGILLSNRRGLASSSGQSIGAGKASVTQHRPFRTSQLPTHLPGLSLLVVLLNSNISIESGSPSISTKSDGISVTISPARITNGAQISQQTWFFSHETHLPTSVITYRESRIPGVMLVDKTFQFDDYIAQDGLLIPHHITEISLANHIVKLIIENIVISGGVD